MLLVWLSSTVLLSWGSLYYAFAVLAGSMARDLGCDPETVTGAFSVALLIWGLVTYPLGLAMERWGARRIMALGSLIAALAFWGLSSAHTVLEFYAGWTLLGLAMGMTLYDAAFATVVQSYPSEHRRRIGWLTIVGGLASTAFWPLTFHLEGLVGWRDTLQVFAALHAITAVTSWPLRLAGTVAPMPAPEACRLDGTEGAGLTRSRPHTLMLLTGCFTLYGFVTAAIAVVAISLLQARGFSPGTAVALAACIGPAQALGRSLDVLFGARFNVGQLGWITLGLMCLSLVALWLARWEPALCLLFIFTYGIGLGLLTILKATTPLALGGPARYAATSGLIGSPPLIARAMGPIVVVWLIHTYKDDGPVLLILLVACLLGAWMFLRVWTLRGRA
ncbi:MFS transporter [Nitrogeniibacter aestuarii]|uniref:MFS transporter n=1 Tax=Nitrogeniibacter aestuarii TaxID=2815343 RepID=UPI001E5E45A1|nr:MFS transporter [Nitrogeniibacter aestuarii]